MVKAVKLSKAQIRELHAHLAAEALENYELLWVLESCLETPTSNVYGLGEHPWAAGLLVIHRQCAWIRLKNEMLFETLLEPLPELEMHRFFTTSLDTLGMLKRWFPQGQLSQSRLCVRNLTKTWRKRFDVSLEVSPDLATAGGNTFLAFAEDRIVATCTSQLVVLPWHELVQWSLKMDSDKAYWTEHALGAITAALLSEGSPVIVRVADEELFVILETLGYREFSQLYYYVAAGE